MDFLILMPNRATSPRSWARVAFTAGVLLSVLASLAPGWVMNKRNEEELRRQATVLQRSFGHEVDALLSEFRTLAPRWSASDPQAAMMGQPDFWGTPPSTRPELLYPGFVAFESPFPLAPGETTDMLMAASIERGSAAYQQTNTMVAKNLAEVLRSMGLVPIPTDVEKPRFIELKFDSVQQAQMIRTPMGAIGDSEASPLTWALAAPVANRGWLVAPIDASGLSKAFASGTQSEAFDVAVHAGTTEKAPLVGRVAMKTRVSSLRRTVSTATHLGQRFTFAVSAERNFATGSAPNPTLILFGGIIVSSLVALGLRLRRQTIDARVLTDERDAANLLARTDPLTQLPNRLAIAEALERISRSSRVDPMAVLLCDLDRFKIVNDARGHDAGDLLLIEVARRLQRVAPNSLVARLSGDEFVIVLTPTSPEDAIDTAHLVVERLREPFPIGTDQVVIGTSVGVTICQPDTATDRSSLLRDADLAMYAAKRDGGNRVHVATDEIRDSGGAQLDIELELRAAFGTGQLVAWYQPLVDRHDEIRALEALVRWQHPTRGLLSPGLFLPAAKRAGLLAEISTDVLSQVCRDVATWNRQRADHGVDPIIVHVNCVEEQLMDPSFADVVGAYLASSGLNPAHLLLEVSEETAMDRLPKGLPTIQAIRAMGVRFSLDDFGFGNASLTMVRQLGGVAEIKIDKSIVDGLANPTGPDPADVAVIQAVRTFADDQGIVLVAEGIEEPQQRDLLVELGVDLMQGYLFHRPNTPEHTEMLLLPRQSALTPSGSGVV